MPDQDTTFDPARMDRALRAAGGQIGPRADLHVLLKVEPDVLAAGTEVTVDLPDGRTLRVSIPPAQIGQRVRLRDRGQGEPRGDLYLHLADPSWPDAEPWRTTADDEPRASSAEEKAKVDEMMEQILASAGGFLTSASQIGPRADLAKRAYQADPDELAARAQRLPKGRAKGQLNASTRRIRDFILEQLVPQFRVMTVRQVFYQVEVAGLTPKTEPGYKRVQAQVLNMRREGVLPWSFISDATRWQRKPATHASAEDYIESMARGYRRDLWQRQGARIEVWLEKDALAGIVAEVTSKWDVALMVSRGTSSATFLYSAAQAAESAWVNDETETFIYMLYDYDAAGERSAGAVERGLREYAALAPVTCERIAITPEQIDEWNLPTRPAKAKDPQAKAWAGKPSVELDAIMPDQLQGLVEAAITRHVDERAWEVEQAFEAEERKGLLELAKTFNNPEA